MSEELKKKIAALLRDGWQIDGGWVVVMSPDSKRGIFMKQIDGFIIEVPIGAEVFDSPVMDANDRAAFIASLLGDKTN